MDSTAQAHYARYLSAAHAMQTGVKLEISRGNMSIPEMHKDLRVGVNSAMVEHAALVKLLLDKDIIAEVEYYKYLAEAFEAEAKRYEERVSAALGGPGIKLY